MKSMQQPARDLIMTHALGTRAAAAAASAA